MNQLRLPMHPGQSAKLRELGYDEIWLQNWLASAPARIVAQELTAPRGGSLDILAADGDTYYSIEVQLGEVDASHSFRVFALRVRPTSLS
jgi:Holliday junction resolvase-like predicted endonuclease